MLVPSIREERPTGEYDRHRRSPRPVRLRDRLRQRRRHPGTGIPARHRRRQHLRRGARRLHRPRSPAAHGQRGPDPQQGGLPRTPQAGTCPAHDHRIGRRRRHIDLSHTVEDGMTTYPGLPAPVIGDFMSREDSRDHYAPGTELQIGSIQLCANTGTYVDSPFHRYADGTDLAGLPLDRLADLDAVVVNVTGNQGRSVIRQQLLPYEFKGRAVLVHTGWDRHWGTEAYFQQHPFLAADAATLLVESGAALVGIDSLNIDDNSTGERPVHTTLLEAGIPICEHLTNLDQLPALGCRFSAVPVKVRGMGSFPVRAYASVR